MGTQNYPYWITSTEITYNKVEVIWIFAPIQQEAKHDQEKLSAEQK